MTSLSAGAEPRPNPSTSAPTSVSTSTSTSPANTAEATEPPRLFALVPCAGSGSRAGSLSPKQYAPLAGRPLVAHTLAALAQVPRLAATLVVLAPDDDQFEEFNPGFTGPQAWLARCGGASRADSVANGLVDLQRRGAKPQDWVLVHDAARCLVRPEWIDRLIDACIDDEVAACWRCHWPTR